MLRFFRQIRKKLIVQESIRKYLLYALGEILLVVIGILIALQVNNWNEERKSAATETKTLVTLKGELTKNLRITQDNYKRNSATLDTLIRYFKGEYDDLSKRRKAEVVMVLNNHSPLQLNMPALQQELNTDPKIQDYPEIRDQLFEITYNFNQVIKRLNYLDDTWTQYISPIMTSEGQGRSFLNLYMEWEEDKYEAAKAFDVPNYEDILSVKFSQLSIYAEWIDSLKSSQQEALDLIDNALTDL